MKLINVLIVFMLAIFTFDVNAASRPPVPPHPGHHMGQFPPCGACKKPTKGPGKDTPCTVATGYKCHPGLSKNEKGQWYIAPPPGHHRGPPPSCEKCGQPCPPPHVHKKCSKGGECHPKMPPSGQHMGPPPPPKPAPHTWLKANNFRPK